MRTRMRTRSVLLHARACAFTAQFTQRANAYILQYVVCGYRERGEEEGHAYVSTWDHAYTLILKGGIFMSIGNSPEVLSRRIFVGTILVGRLGADPRRARRARPGVSGAEPSQHLTILYYAVLDYTM